MSDGKSEAMEAMRAEQPLPSFTNGEREQMLRARAYLNQATSAMLALRETGDYSELVLARQKAGEAVRAIGEMMTERGL